MFGLYRLILALLVALSHFGLIIHGFDPGQFAVICFYVLSGFLMERQFHKLSPSGGITAFYVDRLLRIYPVYFVVCFLCSLANPVSFLDLLINFTLLPLNYSTFTHIPILVGPAWSLACEAHFYILVPLFAIMPNRALHIILALSLMLFSFSAILPYNTFWAYTGLPGMLFAFLSGMLINRRDLPFLQIIYGITLVLFLVFLCSKIFATGYRTGININVCVGYLIAIPFTFYLSRLSPKVAWDQFFGLFSYPLFLVHMLILELCLRYLSHVTIFEFIVFSVFSSGLLVLLIEKPSDLVRYRMRKKVTSASH